MTDEELKQRLLDPEDGWTERKEKGVATEDITKTIVAFANSLADGHSGILFIGVSNKGTIEGVDATDALQKRVRYAAEPKCYPPIRLGHNCRVLREEGKDVVAVIVEASNSRPHFAGPVYVRVGSESVAATEEQYEQLIASRLSKARPLLELMRTGELVTVMYWSHGRSNRHVGASPLLNCRVIAVTAQYAAFQPATGSAISAPYDRITVSKNYATGQLQVDVEN